MRTLLSIFSGSLPVVFYDASEKKYVKELSVYVEPAPAMIENPSRSDVSAFRKS